MERVTVEITEVVLVAIVVGDVTVEDFTLVTGGHGTQTAAMILIPKVDLFLTGACGNASARAVLPASMDRGDADVTLIVFQAPNVGMGAVRINFMPELRYPQFLHHCERVPPVPQGWYHKHK